MGYYIRITRNRSPQSPVKGSSIHMVMYRHICEFHRHQRSPVVQTLHGGDKCPCPHANQRPSAMKQRYRQPTPLCSQLEIWKGTLWGGGGGRGRGASSSLLRDGMITGVFIDHC